MSIGNMNELTKNAKIVLNKRYLQKDADGNIVETPTQLFKRVAHDIALAEGDYGEDVKKTEEEFRNIMANLEFLPNSPTLMNAGTAIQQLSACFVLPVEDSMAGIFEAIKDTALIHQSGGGTGFSFSKIRPKGDIVRSTGGVASGPISFMKVFNASTDVIKQGGKRRGANMGILRVDHPDIEEFITAKEDLEELTNFNLSVALTENFMRAVKEKKEYNLVNPHNNSLAGTLDAESVFNTIIEKAWKTGEPGIVFLDRINKVNPVPHIGDIEATNPCGEQPLLPYESCNLGSINLSKMISQGKIDYEKLGSTVHTAIHFLDNVIDRNRYPLQKIRDMTLANRKIGLGVMGFADMLLQLGIPYNSDGALKTAEKVMDFIQKEGRKASKKLGEKRGSFKNFKGSIWEKEKFMRNATVTTIAPTGTISIIAGCSSGIEPLFAIFFIRNVLDKDDRLIEVNPHFEKVAKQRGFYSDELMKKIAEKGSIQVIDEIPDDIKKVFVTAHDISPDWHIQMQSAFQKYTDNAVSKTVNFRQDATKDDIRKAYLMAYQLGCKGVTVYRDGSRKDQVLTSKKSEGEAELKPLTRPISMIGITRKIGTGCGNLYVTINETPRGPFEIFSQLGKAGGCAAAQSEAVSRLISLCLRSGIEADVVVRQLRGIRCPSPFLGGTGPILSCPDAIAKAIEIHIKKEEIPGERIVAEVPRLDKFGPETASEDPLSPVGVCPDCGNPLIYEEGCRICKQCGYSTCG